MKTTKNITIMLFVITAFIMGTMFLPALASAKEFKNASPAFSFSYPDDFVPADKTSEDQVIAVKSPASVPSVQAGVAAIPAGVALQDIGKAYAKTLEARGDNVKIVSNKPSKLTDGTEANEVIIEWTYMGAYELTSMALSIFKDGKWVYVAGHHMGDIEDVKKIAYTLTAK